MRLSARRPPRCLAGLAQQAIGPSEIPDDPTDAANRGSPKIGKGVRLEAANEVRIVEEVDGGCDPLQYTPRNRKTGMRSQGSANAKALKWRPVSLCYICDTPA